MYSLFNLITGDNLCDLKYDFGPKICGGDCCARVCLFDTPREGVVVYSICHSNTCLCCVAGIPC